jgi:CheY-like chemotaxis protein
LRSSKLLLFMINDILDLTQINNGKLRLNSVVFPLVDVINDVTKLIKFQAKQKGLLLTFENHFPRSSFPVNFSSDPNRLKQIILNLLGNALKFTEKGQIKIIIEPPSQDLESKRKIFHKENKIIEASVIITVQDTGCGIKEEDQIHLFQLFGKLESSESKRVNQAGIGLGLAISQNLVRFLTNNKEEIKVKSEIGKGSSFSFTLHSITNQNDEINEEDEEFFGTDEPPTMKCRTFSFRKLSLMKKRKRILLVDDDQINILVLINFFKTFEDCDYDLAFNGLQAVDIVKQKAREKLFYDIILMDCNMPVMDGFEATRNILQMVEKSEIPLVAIIASTANASPHDYENCFKMGMVDYIAKPFLKAQLRAKIDDCYTKFMR